MLPTCTNIFAIYQRIVQDDYETDMIELTKELSENQYVHRVDQKNEIDFRQLKKSDFSEIYLFFDYDGHNNNLPKGIDVNSTLTQLLDVFDNETDMGKMYISYPMIESIKHFSSLNICNGVDQCRYPIDCGVSYKYDVSQCTFIQDIRKLNLSLWKFIVKKFIVSASCLFDISYNITIEKYKKDINPKNIYDYQLNQFIYKSQEVMIMSAFPEFLLDYFKIDVLDKIFGIEWLFGDIDKYKNKCEKAKEFAK